MDPAVEMAPEMLRKDSKEFSFSVIVPANIILRIDDVSLFHPRSWDSLSRALSASEA